MNTKWTRYGLVSFIILGLSGVAFPLPFLPQLVLSVLYSTILPFVTLIAIFVIYVMGLNPGDTEFDWMSASILFGISFMVTTIFWILFVTAIGTARGPGKDTVDLWFIYTFMPAMFTYWWTGVTVSITPEITFFVNDKIPCLRFIKRIVIGTSGGILAGYPIYYYVEWIPL